MKEQFGASRLPSARAGAGKDARTVAAAGGGIGAALVATVAGACCVGPVVSPILVSVLGAGGAARAAGLKPYSPWLLLGSLLLLGLGFWSVHRRRLLCAAGACQPSPRAVRITLWVGLAVWATAFALNVVARVVA